MGKNITPKERKLYKDNFKSNLHNLSTLSWYCSRLQLNIPNDNSAIGIFPGYERILCQSQITVEFIVFI